MPARSAIPGRVAIDSPAMRHAGAQPLSLALMDARNHVLRLLAAFEEAGACANVPERSDASALWLAGHVGWLQEAWISRNTQRALGPACPAQPVRLASIEPRADAAWDPALRGLGSHELPSLATTRAYLLETLEATLELLEKAGDSDAALYFFRLALCHEDACGEQLVEMAQALDVPLKLELPPGSAARPAVLVPDTRWRLGWNAPGFAFDHERGVHEVQVPSFEIDAQPVRWSQFAEFVADGGYDEPVHWLPEGWAWIQSRSQQGGSRAPRYVQQIGPASGAVLQTRFGRDTRVAGGHNALHVSWWEADAWCRWAGRRLPSEVEWEVAAHTAPGLGFRWGDVHEWTGTTLRPWPGFEAGPVAIAHASLGRAKARRGASFATHARMKHPKIRGFALPDRDDAFVGFRSVG